MNPELSVALRHSKNESRKEVIKKLFCKEVYADLIGPMATTSIHGNRYALLLSDIKSKYSWIYFLKNKDEVKLKIFDYDQTLRTKGFTLGCLRTDGGGEFINEDLKNYAKGKFELRTSPPQHS